MQDTVLVKYTTAVGLPIARDVFVDGTQDGTTNLPFAVETGTHKFDLGMPKDYAPDSITRTVSGTSPLDPAILEFKQVP
jgi:hypothetical protein